MNNQNRNSFETIENLGAKAGQVVKQTVAVVGQDISEQLGLKEISKDKKEEIKKEDQNKKAVVARNLDAINKQIAEIKKRREQKQEQVKHVDNQAKKQNEFEKKKKESLLAKIIKSQQGTKEGVNRVGG